MNKEGKTTMEGLPAVRMETSVLEFPALPSRLGFGGFCIAFLGCFQSVLFALIDLFFLFFSLPFVYSYFVFSVCLFVCLFVCVFVCSWLTGRNTSSMYRIGLCVVFFFFYFLFDCIFFLSLRVSSYIDPSCCVCFCVC